MKLRNKKTGEIIEKYPYSFVINSGEQIRQYDSLGELYAEWEDYEEPKTFFTIYYDGTISEFKDGDDEQIRDMKSIGNYFDTREEAEKAVEKLKAVKRLKDKGFRFLGYYHRLGETKSKGEIGFEMVDYEGTKQDLDLLFGGEE